MKTPEEKIQFLQRQCEVMWEKHEEMAVDCPYCYRRVQIGEGPCCELMQLAIAAILERARAVDEAMKCHERREFGRMIMGKNYLN
jgi:hypothetical protein